MVRVVVRHRGDGRAIYDEVPAPPPPDVITADFETIEHRMVAWMGRRVGKSALFGMKYGTKQLAWSQAARMFGSNQGKAPRDPSNGPFSVVLDPSRKWVRRSKRHGGMKEPGHKVINANGWRVHRGSKASCDSVCDNLNTEHAKWIMTKEDDRFMFIDSDTLYRNTMQRFGRINP
jgi:hypothetical protein